MAIRVNVYESTHAGKALSVWQDERGSWWMEIDVAVLPSTADCSDCAQAEAHAHMHQKFSHAACPGDPTWVAVASSLPPAAVRPTCKVGQAGMRSA